MNQCKYRSILGRAEKSILVTALGAGSETKCTPFINTLLRLVSINTTMYYVYIPLHYTSRYAKDDNLPWAVTKTPSSWEAHSGDVEISNGFMTTTVVDSHVGKICRLRMTKESQPFLCNSVFSWLCIALQIIIYLTTRMLNKTFCKGVVLDKNRMAVAFSYVSIYTS